MTVPDEQTEAAGVARGTHRNVALDGIRGLAVLLVSVSHASVPIVKLGGTVGVTVFFVLSGYLITTLLFTEQARRGAISLGKFYLRRVLRLLPALAVALVAGVVLVAVLGSGSGSGRAAAAAGVTLLYVNNIVRFNHVSVFPFGTYWSLSMEEQFYLVWPVLLILGRALRRRTFVVMCAVAAVASLAARFVGRIDTTAGYERAYYLPYTNAWALLIGVIVAAYLAEARPRVPAWTPNVALLGLIATATVLGLSSGLREHADPQTYLLRLIAGPIAAGFAILLIVSAVSGSASRTWMRHRILVYFGGISYGLYLWDGILDETLTNRFGGSSFKNLLFGSIATVLAVGAAALSRRYVEEPFLRLKDRLGADRHGDPAAAIDSPS